MDVAVLGASNKPARYSCQAVKLLVEKGHAVFPVHPAVFEIDGIPVFKRLADIPTPIRMITVYLAPERSAVLADPYRPIKERMNRMALDLLPDLAEAARLQPDPCEAFVRPARFLRNVRKNCVIGLTGLTSSLPRDKVIMRHFRMYPKKYFFYLLSSARLSPRTLVRQREAWSFAGKTG